MGVEKIGLKSKTKQHPPRCNSCGRRKTLRLLLAPTREKEKLGTERKYEGQFTQNLHSEKCV